MAKQWMSKREKPSHDKIRVILSRRTRKKGRVRITSRLFKLIGEAN